ncbi:MAG: hypothetical protein ABR970_01015 [Roseiarcus sp.]|jgi:hypothetical protein
MTTLYRHTQPGALTLGAMLSAAAGMATIGLFCPSPSARSLLWGGAGVLAALAWFFSSLTVEVTEDELLWRFGPGIPRYRMARAEIVSVRAVRNEFWNGFGVRMRPGFRLYNISGLDAVELRLRNGAICRIGSDDPSGLAAALAA